MNKRNRFNKLDVEHSQRPASIELELHETSKTSTLNELADAVAEKLKERGLVFGQLKSVADRNRDNNQELPYITCTTTTASVHVSGKETELCFIHANCLQGRFVCFFLAYILHDNFPYFGITY